MDLFRIAREEYVRDLSGVGARIYGGRWNRKGSAVIYTSETRSLATVEFLVHVPIGIRPAGLSIARLRVPDRFVPEAVERSRLPANWRTYPAPPELAGIGTNWIRSSRSLLLRVPSAVVDGEFNILINPDHPGISKVRIASVEDLRIDERLLRLE
jgi:RES domain-containing protein